VYAFIITFLSGVDEKAPSGVCIHLTASLLYKFTERIPEYIERSCVTFCRPLLRKTPPHYLDTWLKVTSISPHKSQDACSKGIDQTLPNAGMTVLEDLEERYVVQT